MSPKDTLLQSEKHSEIYVAEAAAWVAHLHGTRRTPDSDRGLQLWLKDDPARARALEVANEVWNEVGDLQGAAMVRALDLTRHVPKRKAYTGWAIAAGVLLASVIGALFAFQNPGVSSEVGEQRTLVLEDGSRVVLNTATRVVVHYDHGTREVELKTGEARFDVAQDPRRPFVVTAGLRRIEALGTSFLVRYEAEKTAVTLVEGKVSVAPSNSSAFVRAQDRHKPPILSAGQRLTFVKGKSAMLDTPPLEKVTAWQRGEVVMDGMRLREAVREMNRYSERPLTVRDARAANLLVSGVFQSGDSLRFANAVADTYSLKVISNEREILIDGDPRTVY